MPRPNLVLFMPDQLRADAVGCFGSPVAHTPVLDELAARGTRFDDAWSQHSVCGPSRVSIMTGWYPHVHGHRTLVNLLEAWEPNMLAMLRDAGYYVAIAGNRGDVFAPGVTEASSDFCGYLVQPTEHRLRFTSPYEEGMGHRMHRAMYFGSPGDDVVIDLDEAVTQTAEQWLAEGAPKDQPWVLWMPLIFPHPPFTVEEPWFSMHDRSAMPAPIPRSARAGKPRFMDGLADIYGWDELTDDDFAEIAATYHGMISRLDSQLGRIVEAVDRIGATDNTVFAHFTDHGEYLGDFGLVEKWPSGLDPSLLRNPLVLSGGPVPEGRVVTSPVEMNDLLPTLLEWAEYEPQYTHFGQSLQPVMDDPSIEHRPFTCAEGGFRPRDSHLLEKPGAGIYEPKGRLQREQPELVGHAAVLRTSTHTYVHRAEERDELYDRVADPDEITNRIDDPALADVAADLKTKMFDWLVDTSDVIGWDKHPRFPEVPNGWR